MIVILANCIGVLYATSIEIVLMSKIELLKRTSIILFTLVEVIVSALLYFNQENTILLDLDDIVKAHRCFKRNVGCMK